MLQPKMFLTAAVAKHCVRCLCMQLAARFDSHGGELSTVSGYDWSRGLYCGSPNS